MYVAVLSTQKNVLQDDADKLRTDLEDGKILSIEQGSYFEDRSSSLIKILVLVNLFLISFERNYISLSCCRTPRLSCPGFSFIIKLNFKEFLINFKDHGSSF